MAHAQLTESEIEKIREMIERDEAEKMRRAQQKSAIETARLRRLYGICPQDK